MTPTADAWAEEYAHLEARLADVTADRDAYQQIAHAALDQLHATTKALDRTRRQLYRLTEQVRARRSLSTVDSEAPAGTYTTKHGTEAPRRRSRSVYRPTAPEHAPEARL